MKYIKTEHLILFPTTCCNLKCAHCMRTDHSQKEIIKTWMSDDTINNIFNQINEVKYLEFSGGEPLLAAEQIKKIFKVIKERQTIINNFGLITNGTVFTKDMEKLFIDFSSYLKEINQTKSTDNDKSIVLSKDDYHTAAINELPDNIRNTYQENIEYLRNSKILKRRQFFTPFDELYDCGNAIHLDVPKQPISPIIEGDLKLIEIERDDNTTTISGDIGIAPNGDLIPSSISFDKAHEKYTYGNINNGKIIEQISIHIKKLKRK